MEVRSAYNRDVIKEIPYIEENTNNYKSSARVRSTPATRPYESLALKTISTRPKP